MVRDRTSLMVHIGNLSLVPTRMKLAPTPGRSLSDQRQTGSAVILGHLIPLPHDSLGVRERGFSQVKTQLHQLTGPTHQSLTDTGGDYNLQGVAFPHTTLQPSQLMVLPFPPKGPARSLV
jgi:hypothetical protein